MKMNYEQYEAFKKMLKEEMHTQNMVFTERQVLKVNQKLDGISIKDAENETIEAVFYPKACFRDYQNGKTVQDIVKELREKADESKSAQEVISNVKGNLENQMWKECLIAQVINTKKNDELLSNLPHRNLLDLSVIYRIAISDGMSIVVDNKMLSNFDMDENQIFAIAKENLLKKHPFFLFSLFGGLCGIKNEMSYGANAILFETELDKAAEHAGDDIYILPSSIHELLFVKAKEHDEAALLETVKEVNETTVDEEDFLSDNLYHYDRITKELRLIEQ